MRKQMPDKISKTLFLLLGIMFFMVSCNNRPEGVMSKSEMIDFLTDLHKLDGTLATKGIGTTQNRENIYYYNSLLKKHEITQANFDSSLVWYSKNPKNFAKIYAQVIENLTDFEKDIKKGKYNTIDSTLLRHSQENIWRNQTSYTFTKDSTREQLEFTIQNTPLQWQDSYSLSFTQRISPKDSSTSQHVVLRINYSGGITDSVYATTYNDSILRRYTLTLAARKQKRIESISGKLLGSKTYQGQMGAKIDSVKLIRRFDAIAQDSINRIISLIENPTPVSPTEPVKNKSRLRTRVLMHNK